MNPYNKFSKEKELEIIKMYNEDISQKDIAIHFNTFNTSIRRVLLRNNIIIRNNSDIQKLVKVNPFKVMSNESEYFLGLLISDGCISNNRITLGLKYEDYYMLENYKNFLGNLVKINKYFHKKHNTYQYQVNFRSKEISNTLQNLANFINKSFEAKLVIPITWNILRGIFDGDGCFVFLNNNNSLKFNIITCSIKLSNQIKDFLINNGYSPTITKSKNIYNINLYKKLELIRLFKDLYKGSDIYLIRKYQKLATFVEKSTIKNTLNSGKDTLLTLSEASNEERAETIIGAPTY